MLAVPATGATAELAPFPPHHVPHVPPVPPDPPPPPPAYVTDAQLIALEVQVPPPPPTLAEDDPAALVAPPPPPPEYGALFVPHVPLFPWLPVPHVAELYNHPPPLPPFPPEAVNPVDHPRHPPVAVIVENTEFHPLVESTPLAPHVPPFPTVIGYA